MYPIRTILHPTDFSEDSDEAFRVAWRWAATTAPGWWSCTSKSPEVVYSGFISRPSPDLYREELAEGLHRLVEAAPTLEVETILTRGSAADEILRMAAETLRPDRDGARGQTGLGRLVMGSVAEAILRGPSVPC